MKLIDKIKNHDWYVFTDIMTVVGPALLFILIAMLTSCGTIQYVPIEQEQKVIVRDSLIYITDSILVEVPYEVIKEVIPDIDTSYLETSLAKSTAYLDTTSRKLNHSLEQKGTLQTVIDTFYITQIKEVEKMVEVPIEVVKTEYKRDGLFWYLLAFHIIAILYLLARLYFKR